ncbi:hypothetical protein K504DRAFT_343752, partial [Pleomassaria siparia CBS 279.74]
VKQGLRAAEFTIWLTLVKKVNKQAIRVGNAIRDWLGQDCIAGGPITPKELLGIKTVPLAEGARFEEVANSNNKDEE